MSWSLCMRSCLVKCAINAYSPNSLIRYNEMKPVWLGMIFVTNVNNGDLVAVLAKKLANCAMSLLRFLKTLILVISL